MNAYELMIKTNHFLVKGGVLTESQKDVIVSRLLSAQTQPEQAKRFYNRVRYPNNIDGKGRQMYPIFFIPPYNNGMKLKTILGQTPKTHIFSANMYEIEIIRLLYLFAPDNVTIRDLVNKTLSRLRSTCFGNCDDGVGECFDTSLVVLRFLAAVVPEDSPWIQSRIDNYNRHMQDKKRPWFSKWYFWLCLSELPFDIAEPEISKYRNEIIPWLTSKSMVMNSDHDTVIHPLLLCMLRNLMSRYPEYAHIKAFEPYVSDKDGRLHFGLSIQ